MPFPMRALVLLLLLLPAWQNAVALDIPPKPEAWVTDRAGILSAETELELNRKLDSFARSSGSQILVMTFPALEGEAIEDYTIRVAEQWKVRDDRALILFVFVAERLVRIEVGYGLEGTITDAVADQTIRQVITPRFRAGDYDRGIREAVEVLTARIEGNESPIAFDGAGTQEQAPLGMGDILFFLLILFIFMAILGPLVSRTGLGGCGGCGCLPIPFFFPGRTFGGHHGSFGGGGGGGGGFNVGGSWGGGGFGSFGGGGATGGW